VIINTPNGPKSTRGYGKLRESIREGKLPSTLSAVFTLHRQSFQRELSSFPRTNPTLIDDSCAQKRHCSTAAAAARQSSYAWIFDAVDEKMHRFAGPPRLRIRRSLSQPRRPFGPIFTGIVSPGYATIPDISIPCWPPTRRSLRVEEAAKGGEGVGGVGSDGRRWTAMVGGGGGGGRTIFLDKWECNAQEG
jgi:hypothetical protein